MDAVVTSPEGPDVLAPEIRIFLISALSAMLIVCVLGNSLTLVAVPYVIDKYKTEFSALQNLLLLLLLLNLSFTDLLYGVLGFPHFIHGLVFGRSQALCRSLIFLLQLDKIHSTFLVETTCAGPWPC